MQWEYAKRLSNLQKQLEDKLAKEVGCLSTLAEALASRKKCAAKCAAKV